MRFHPALFNQGGGGSPASVYDTEIQSLDLLYYVNDPAKTEYTHTLTLSDLLSQNLAAGNSPTYGNAYFDSWFIDTGYDISDYQQLTVDMGGTLWYSNLDDYVEVV